MRFGEARVLWGVGCGGAGVYAIWLCPDPYFTCAIQTFCNNEWFAQGSVILCRMMLVSKATFTKLQDSLGFGRFTLEKCMDGVNQGQQTYAMIFTSFYS